MRDNLMLTDAELMRYSRQILLSDWDIDAQLRLKHSRVVIVGAGGLGCPAAETLARAGIGDLHIIDDDLIEVSNLQRQTLFTLEDSNQPKAEVAASRLRQINELIRVSHTVARVDSSNAEQLLQLKDKNGAANEKNETAETVAESKQEQDAVTKTKSKTEKRRTATASQPTDLILDCTDNFAIRELLNRLSVIHQVPLLSASAIGMVGQLALFEPALNNGCYHCVFGEAMSHSSDEEGRNCANSGVLASTTAVMGALQANAALQYLGQKRNPIAQRLLLWDGQRMTQRLVKYQADPTCAVCGS